ncbi:PREDICTED: uncharacterized protein LOC102028242 isoform X2 [Chinchilla lanigera]|uniref:uncharacterized protein LOC102028242 isoform X2 n=1 Tax=Chinchilla lanigera TaxID=34839 RepID=UPI000697D0FA|nr:PREDICTED: uncharacterized protein LOC102028242 isoform X2 [Chinchilla lanigera]
MSLRFHLHFRMCLLLNALVPGSQPGPGTRFWVLASQSCLNEAVDPGSPWEDLSVSQATYASHCDFCQLFPGDRGTRVAWGALLGEHGGRAQCPSESPTCVPFRPALWSSHLSSGVKKPLSQDCLEEPCTLGCRGPRPSETYKCLAEVPDEDATSEPGTFLPAGRTSRGPETGSDLPQVTSQVEELRFNARAPPWRPAWDSVLTAPPLVWRKNCSLDGSPAPPQHWPQLGSH